MVYLYIGESITEMMSYHQTDGLITGGGGLRSGGRRGLITSIFLYTKHREGCFITVLWRSGLRRRGQQSFCSRHGSFSWVFVSLDNSDGFPLKSYTVLFQCVFIILRFFNTVTIYGHAKKLLVVSILTVASLEKGASPTRLILAEKRAVKKFSR